MANNTTQEGTNVVVEDVSTNNNGNSGNNSNKSNVDLGNRNEQKIHKTNRVYSFVLPKKTESKEDTSIQKLASNSVRRDSLLEKTQKTAELVAIDKVETESFLSDTSSLLDQESNKVFSYLKKRYAENPKGQSALDYTNDLKAHVVKTFFKSKENLDYLTTNGKNAILSYIKAPLDKQKEKAHIAFRYLKDALEIKDTQQAKKFSLGSKNGNVNESPLERTRREYLKYSMASPKEKLRMLKLIKSKGRL